MILKKAYNCLNFFIFVSSVFLWVAIISSVLSFPFCLFKRNAICKNNDDVLFLLGLQQYHNSHWKIQSADRIYLLNICVQRSKTRCKAPYEILIKTPN